MYECDLCICLHISLQILHEHKQVCCCCFYCCISHVGTSAAEVICAVCVFCVWLFGGVLCANPETKVTWGGSDPWGSREACMMEIAGESEIMQEQFTCCAHVLPELCLHARTHECPSPSPPTSLAPVRSVACNPRTRPVCGFCQPPHGQQSIQRQKDEELASGGS